MDKLLLILLLTLTALNGAYDIKKYEPVQITTSSSKESSIVIKDDNVIYFASDRSGSFNVFKKDLAKEIETQITSLPNNEHPVLYDGRIIMRSDETDVYGNLYYLKDSGEQELLFSAIGEECNPCLNGRMIYFSEKKKDGYFLKSFNLKKRKKPKQVRDGIGEKAYMIGRNDLLYQSYPDASGFSNLFISYMTADDSSGISEPMQITFGQKIITGFDVSKDEKTIVYSAVTTDTNGDGKTDVADNSILYRITGSDEGYSDAFQLTSESYSSTEPKIAPDGRIFFVSDRKGNPDIWYCGPDGVAPYTNDPSEQKKLADYLFENYKAQVLLAEAMKEKITAETEELLSNALLSYYRAVSIPSQSDAARADAYFRIAEIYSIQKKFRMAESIYRIVQNRFQANELISGTAELKRVTAELSKREISTKELGYELDDHLKYLNSMIDKYKDTDVLNSIQIRIGEIYYDLERYPEANSRFVKARYKNDKSENAESYYRMARSALGSGNSQSAGILIEKALKFSASYDEKENYIRGYFSRFTEDVNEDAAELITEIKSNEELSPELRSCASLILGGLTTNDESRTGYFNEVKQFYVSDPQNVLLKKYSAQADIRLAEIYTQTGPDEAVESIYEYMTDNYGGINYDLYSTLASKRLSEIYLKKAGAFYEKKMFDNALLVYSKAYELNRANAEVIRGMIDSYAGLKKINEAVAFFSDEYAKDPNNAYYNYALGYAYSVRGSSGKDADKADMTRAAELIGRSIEIDSGLKYSYLTLAYCYEALYHIGLKETELEKNRNIFRKSLDLILGPLKFLLQTVNIIEDTDKDYTDLAVSVLGKGLALCDDGADKELILKMKLNTANNYYNMGEYARKQALDFYKQITDGGYKFSSKAQEAIVYERTGHCLFTLDDESADEYYSKALEIYKELNDRKGELRVSMRTALLYLTREDKEGDLIGGDDAYQKYSDIIIKLKSEDNKKAVDLIKRNSAFARFVDEEYQYASELTGQIIAEESDYKDRKNYDNMIIMSLLGIDIPVWKLDIVLGSQYAEGFEGKDELALLYSIEASSYSSLKEFNAVKELLNKKAEIFKKKGNDLALSLIENRLGILEYFRRDRVESIKKFRASNELCIKLGLYNIALVNENNILKAMASDFNAVSDNETAKALADTSIWVNSKENGELYDRAVNRNLRGLLSYLSYKKKTTGTPAERFSAIRELIGAERFFIEADTLLNSVKRKTEEVNRLSASVLYNLAMVCIEADDTERAGSFFDRGYEAAELTYDKLLKWRYLMKKGDLEADPEAKQKCYADAEKMMSEYLPQTNEYELVSGWRDDIKPLYDRLIAGCLNRNDISSAMNYAERYKNRMLLNYYSSRYLDYKEQLHKIHIKKIRYNNEEIVRYRQKADLLKNKNPEKYASMISEYQEKADFYEKELADIYDQIKRSNDERLLQFVSIEDMNEEKIAEDLGEYRAVISVYSMPGKELYFYFGGSEYKAAEAPAGDFSRIFDGFDSEIKEKEHIFIVPDFNGSVNADFVSVMREKGYTDTGVSILPSLSSLRMAVENANINYSEHKISSKAEIAEKDLPAYFENGGIINIDEPIKTDPSNSLENVFVFGSNEVRLGDFLKFKMPAYAVVINGFEGAVRPEDKLITANSLIFSGAQSVIIQNENKKDTLLSAKLYEKASEQDILTVLKDSNVSYTLIGLTGMNRQGQKEFAEANLKSSLMNGVRYYNSKVYEKAAVYFIQALAMARNIGDKQELNILKTLVSSLRNIKDHKRAVIYSQQLIDYTEKNGPDKERLSAYDEISRNYILNKQYDESIIWQEKILSDEKSTLKDRVSAYNMLSVIYSYKGDLKKSISCKKEYLVSSGLLSEPEITSIKTGLNESSTEILFNSLRNIMVSYYKNNETDSALFVYDTIIKNLDEFEDVDGASFGELTESAGLCYFKKSLYSRAEELYIEALDYFKEGSERASVYINLSDLYYYTDRLSSALKYLGMAEKEAVSDSELMRIYNTRSLVEVKLDDLGAARTYSYKTLEKTIGLNDRSEESTARVNLAKILILSNDIAGAEKNLELSMLLARETKNIKAMISAEYYKGELYLKNLKKPDSALFHYKNSLGLAVSSGDEFFRSKALLGTGSTFLGLNNPDSCGYYLKKSTENAELYGFSDIYLESAYTLSGLYENDQAQLSIEILEQLCEKARKLSAENENQFSEEQENIVRPAYSRRIDLLLRSSRTEDALNIVRERDDLFARNDLKYFGIRSQMSDKPATGTLESIKKKLAADTAMLIFLPYGQNSYLIAVKAGDHKTFSFPVTKELKGLPEKIESKGDFISDAVKSYQTVFTKDALSYLEGVKDIIIYSDGDLKNYPFEVLYDGQNYLIDKFNIAEAAELSVSDLKVSGAAVSKSLSFVNPFTAESELVYAEREYSALSRSNKNSTVTNGQKATETLLKNESTKQYGMLHLPVHSFVLNKDSVRTSGRSSYIQLSADESNDGKLEWGEIIGLDVRNKEIILSGCDTGGKTGSAYFENFDLSSAFRLSGAGTVISSKWRTDDLAASVLMKRYFRYSAAGDDKISALSKAKRDIRTYFNPHPYYWANFKISR